MTSLFAKPEPCWAGRQAFLGGRWQVPCERPMNPTHIITAHEPNAPQIMLCTFHYEWARELGYVDEPDPEWDRMKKAGEV